MQATAAVRSLNGSQSIIADDRSCVRLRRRVTRPDFTWLTTTAFTAGRGLLLADRERSKLRRSKATSDERSGKPRRRKRWPTKPRTPTGRRTGEPLAPTRNQAPCGFAETFGHESADFKTARAGRRHS